MIGKSGRRTTPAIASDSTVDRWLADAVEEFESLVRQGDEPDIDAFCRARPDVAQPLRKALVVARGLARAAETVAPSDFDPVPDVLGVYRIETMLGAGGMARVYRARHERLRRPVALKLLPSTSPLRDRFVREARALASVNHPRVVAVHDLGESSGFAYFAMELLEGSLAARVLDSARPGDLPPPTDVVRWLIEAAEGLSALHASGIVHRDLKPSNLLLGADGHVRVGDLGLARREGESALTRTGHAVGTPSHAAPEQLRQGVATVASDVFGLGACAHHLLTGRPPPPPGAEPSFPRRVSRGLRRTVRRALDPLPHRRQASAAAFADELTALGQRWRVGRWAWPVLAASVVIAGVEAARGLRPVVGPSPVEPASQRRGTSHVIDAEAYARDPRLLVLRERGFRFEELMQATTTRTALRCQGGGLSHEARLTTDSLGQVVEWHGPAGLLRTATLPVDGRRWSFHERPVDIDGDGFDDVVLSDGSRLALARFSPPDHGDPAVGWRFSSAHAFGYGSAVIADWDDDDSLEVLVGDIGVGAESGRSESAQLLELDFSSGRLVRSWSFDQPIHSTPQFDRTPDGRVIGAYIDTHLRTTRGTRGALHRVTPTSREPERIQVPTGPGGRLTWPILLDVDADGRNELIVARSIPNARRNHGEILCIDPEAAGRPLWSLSVREGITTYPILSQQDEDPAPEACVLSNGALYCINPEPALSESERVAWRVPWSADAHGGAQLVEVGDLDGDGLSEIACGLQSDEILVFSRSVLDGPYARLRPSPEALVQRRPEFIARVVRLPTERRGESRIAAVATTGWVQSWRLRGASVQAEPGLSVMASKHAGVTAFPQVVELPARAGERGRTGLLVLARGLHFIEFSEDGATPPRATWGSWSLSSGVSGTPALHWDGGWLWIVATRPWGEVAKVPLIPDVITERFPSTTGL